MLEYVRRWFFALPYSTPEEQTRALSAQVQLLILISICVLASPVLLLGDIILIGRILALYGCFQMIVGAIICVALLRRGYFLWSIGAVSVITIISAAEVFIPLGLSEGGLMLLAFVIPISFTSLSGKRLFTFGVGLLAIVVLVVLVSAEPILAPIFQTRTVSNRLLFLLLASSGIVTVTLTFDRYTLTLQTLLNSLLARQHELLLFQQTLESMVATRTNALQRALEASDVREAMLARALRSLSESEARTSAIVAAIPDTMLLIDRNNRCVDFKHDHATSLFDDGSPVGKHLSSAFDQPFASVMLERVSEVRASHANRIFEYSCTTIDGERDLELRMTPCGSDVLCIIRDITERKKVERLKNEFVSLVSHELRTPLTSIMGSLGLVIGGVAGPTTAETQQMLSIAQKNAERLIRMINDILDIEQIESGEMPFRIRLSDLSILLRNVAVDLQAYAHQRSVHLVVADGGAHAYALVDNDRMMQVLTNLISNAIKFSPAGCEVRISLERQEQHVRITITDRGPGIPEHFYERIFQRFAQADSSDRRQKGGTGLGLNISKAIVEHFGGTIGFESAVGEGSTFFIEIPVVDAPVNLIHGEEN